ncbi:MAG: tyrosine-type recombinase/integrase [Selenomonadaceae bacterium]|nr:tyrosine-type recombinase/integrase [Selenomonadaceae bacterium]
MVCTRRTGDTLLRGTDIRILHKEHINAHSFRHTHATMLIENGATSKDVAYRLGHANAIITQNLYTHNTEKLQEDTAAIFNKNL